MNGDDGKRNETVFCMGNWPVRMKSPETVHLGGKRFVFDWKG